MHSCACATPASLLWRHTLAADLLRSTQALATQRARTCLLSIALHPSKTATLATCARITPAKLTWRHIQACACRAVCRRGVVAGQGPPRASRRRLAAPHTHSQQRTGYARRTLTAAPRAQVADAAAGKDYLKTGEPDWKTAHPASHKLLGGAVTVYDPALYEDTSTKIYNSLRGAVLAPTFLQYAPCLLFSQPYGFGMFPYGVSIQPTGKGLTLGFHALGFESADVELKAPSGGNGRVADAGTASGHISLQSLCLQEFSSSRQASTSFPKA